ncbi:MAG: hypothetical protein V4691_00120, partial [Pseudomonadota bacterium]
MQKVVTSLIFAAVFSAAPANAMFVRTALLFTPGAELTNPSSKWPVAPQSSALKERLDAYKGANAEEIRAFYALHDYRPVWITSGYWSDRAKAMMARFDHARYDGLQPDDYTKPVFTSLPLEGGDEKLIAEGSDLAEMASAELPSLTAERDLLTEQIRVAMLPKDPY